MGGGLAGNRTITLTKLDELIQQIVAKMFGIANFILCFYEK